jgi:hypothetical protein
MRLSRALCKALVIMKILPFKLKAPDAMDKERQFSIVEKMLALDLSPMCLNAQHSLRSAISGE